MDTRRLSCGRFYALVAWAVVAALGLGTGTASANGPSARAIALFTYHQAPGDGEDELTQSHVFTGVVLNGRYVVTSAAALERGHGDPFAGYEADLTAVRGLVRDGASTIEVKLEPWELMEGPAGRGRVQSDALALLEVAEGDREAVAQVIRSLPDLGTLAGGSPGHLVGVVGPLGADELSAEVVPRPLELTVTWDDPLRDDGTRAVAGDRTYPRQMSGAGVWNAQWELLGVLVRDERRWSFIDAVVVHQLGEATGLSWAEPERFAAEMLDPERLRRPDPQPRAEVRGIYELLDRNNLRMQLDRNLVDWVRRPQSDQVMAMIAGGEYDRALRLLDRLEPLVTGRLREQMTYRRALTYVFQGRLRDAQRGLAGVENVEDELVRARGRLLRQVLEYEEEGRLEGIDVTEPDGLVEGMLTVLSDLEARWAEQVEEIAWRIGMSPVELVMLDLEGVRREVAQYRDAWPGYVEPILERIDELSGQLTRR